MIRSASGASSAGAPVTFGVGQGVLGVGIAVSTGVDADGIGVLDDCPGPDELGPEELAPVDGDASGLLSEQDDKPNTATADTAKTPSPKRTRSPVSFIVSNPPGAGRGSR
ncbi:hypothetical protein GCM10009804_39800 [Kribbella hippodromi]|uniref:Uncharacterized protein n=1 Tax=Kribbella hippodromi TaxID=434347 RepID=A0ABN2DMZ5_9ACTN